MPVTEALMDPGDFRLSLGKDAQHLLDPASPRFVREWGHIVITAQYVGAPEGFTDAGLLAGARYTGVVLEPEWTDGKLTVYGAGLDIHLGDESNNIGPRLINEFDFTDEPLDTALTGMLADSGLTAGTIQSYGSYSGLHEDQMSKEAIMSLIRSLSAIYRINPNGTVDAEAEGAGGIFVEDPNVVIIRHNHGSDAIWTGVPAVELVSRRKARDYMTRVLFGDFPDLESGDSVSRQRGIIDYYGLSGVPLVRVGLVPNPGAIVVGVDVLSVNDQADRVLEENGLSTEETIRLDQYQIVPVDGGLGTIKPGDNVYVWDPTSGFYDHANAPVWFRGEAIAPVRLRVSEQVWPLVDGMGVYYRPPLSTVTPSDWVDLTPYTSWEATQADAQTLLRVISRSEIAS